MQSNVKGRVKNISLPKTQALLPLFEAVVNSIESIHDLSDNASDHRIDVRILREVTLLTEAEPGRPELARILGFEVIDDGVGFNEVNWDAFNEADTQIKADRGGRGVGRFLWLKAFDKVEVDSVYWHDGKGTRRTFGFSLDAPDGITDHRREDVDPAKEPRRTIVRLLGFKEGYETQAPKSAETIALRIVEYCLEHFILSLDNTPTIFVTDTSEGDAIDLDEVFEGLGAKSKLEPASIDGHKFSLIHLTLNAHGGMKHHINYCAQRRVVLEDTVGSKIPNLPSGPFGKEEGGRLIYACYVVSEYLDQHVNQERTAFTTIPPDALAIDGELSWPTIEESVLGACRRFLEPYTQEAKLEKEEHIREFVANEAPQYRHILKHHPEALDRIPSDASDRTLDEELHKIQWQVDADLRRDGDALLAQTLSDDQGQVTEEQLQHFSQWWGEYNDAGKADLAKYIVRRKLTLTLLEQSLERLASGKYPLEKVIHEIIFPLRKTSDDITYEQHNLWVMDEKLSYHTYLASDKPLKDAENLQSEELSRPDLLIFFDRPIAVVDGEAPYNSGIVVFDFKRPMRDDYDEDDNPIQQVLRYVQQIRGGEALTKDGRPIEIAESTPFYCYIVADLTDRLREQADFASLTKTPDASGFFGYNPGVRAYIEVIGFGKLLRDANRRNRILFDKLSLPPTSAFRQGL